MYQEEKLEHKSINLQMIKRLQSYVFKYKYEFLGVAVINFFAVVPGILEPHVIKTGIDKYLAKGNFRGVVYVAAFFLFLKFFKWIVTVINETLIARLGQKVLNNIRLEVFNHVQTLSMDYFDRQFNHLTVSRLLVCVPDDTGLVEFLAAVVGAKVEKLDLSQAMDISAVPALADSEFVAHSLPSLGAALRQGAGAS